MTGTILRLANDSIEAEVLPDLGGRVWSLRSRRTGTDWIWHNPGVRPAPLPPGSSYDDHWAGGWEELFPNDTPGEFMGSSLPDHGEWWSSAWTHEASAERIRMSLACRSVPAACEKTLSLDGAEPRLRAAYRIRNTGARALHFLFKQHLAVAVTPGHRIELPGGRVTQVDPSFSTRVGAPGPFDWPVTDGRDGKSVDLSRLPPPQKKHREFVYVQELPEGWVGVLDQRSGERLRMTFPREIFPYTWLFLSTGGWRDLYTAVLEPCTNMPKDLNEAKRLGRCAVLAPGETLSCEIAVEVH